MTDEPERRRTARARRRRAVGAAVRRAPTIARERAGRRRRGRRRRAAGTADPRRRAPAPSRTAGRVAVVVAALGARPGPASVGRMVRVAARPARRRGRPRSSSRSSRAGVRSEAGDALAASGVIGSSLAFQVWARRVGRRTSRPARTSCARTWACGRRPTRSKRARRRRSPGQVARCCVPPGLTLHADRRPGRRAAGAQRATRSSRSRSRAWCDRSTSRPTVTSLEGLTWPDTYFVGEHQTDEEILRMLVDASSTSAPTRSASAHRDHVGLTPYETIVERVADPGRGGRPTTQPTCRGGDRQPPAATACRSRSTRRSATRRAAARRCRPTPTSSSTRRTTPTASPGCRRRRSSPSPRRRCARRVRPADVPLPLLRDRRRRHHALRDDARRARARTSGRSGVSGE